MARIICHHQDNPIIFVAPHGHQGDDYNTSLIAECAAKEIGANYLINTGFRRNIDVDEARDFADCNNVNHMSDPILRDEFLLPYKRMCIRAKKKYGSALVVFIHGVSDKVRKDSGVLDLDIILGYGLGTPESRTCYEVGVRQFTYQLHEDDINCCIGKAGGKYSGYNKNNMNQYWRKVERDMHINSVQLEIIRELRDDTVISILTAQSIALAAEKCYNCTNFNYPSNFFVSQV
jgi:hypothetical protein